LGLAVLWDRFFPVGPSTLVLLAIGLLGITVFLFVYWGELPAIYSRLKFWFSRF
jgi:hypothetical protein